MKLWINTDSKILEHPISQDGTTSIGRGDGNSLVLKDRDISRFHCEIVAESEGYFELYDLNSTNGTFLNGSKIQKSTIVPGDTIQIGDTLMIVNSLHESRRTPIPKKEKTPARTARPKSPAPDSETDIHENPLRHSLRGRFHQLIVTTQRIAAELDNNKLLDVVLTGAARFAYATRGMVYLKGEDDYQFAVGYNLKESDLQEAEKAFIEALTNRAEVQLDIVQHVFRVGDKRKISGHKSTARFEGIHSLIIPLVSPTHYDNPQNDSVRPKTTPTVYGFIYLDNQSDPLNIDSSDRQLLKALAAQAAIALHNSDLYKQATTDPGTGLLNRDCFKRLLHEELAHARKQEHSLAVAMIDLDFFKNVNDSHGHPYGDVVLKEFAEVLQRLRRDGDLVGRYGGEEFIVCLKHAYPADARQLLETVRGEVAGRLYGEKKIKMTCSIGVATFPNHAKTSDLLIKHADQALYSAKKQGRDQVVIWSDDLDRIGNLQNPMSGFLTGNIARDQRFLDLFFQVSQRLTQELPTVETFRSMTEAVLDVISADALTLFAGTSLTKQIELFKVERSQRRSYSSPEERLGLVRRAIEEHKTVVSEDFSPVSGVFPSYSELVKGNPVPCQRSMCIPLFAYEKICGAYFLEFSQSENTYCSADLNFLEALSRQIALSLHFYHGAQS